MAWHEKCVDILPATTTLVEGEVIKILKGFLPVPTAACFGRKGAARAGLLAVAAAVMAAIPLSSAGAFVFTTTDTGTTGGNPAQEIFTETITSDGSLGSTGSGPPTSFGVNWHASTGPTTYVDANATITILTFTPSELKFQVAVTNDSNFASARLTVIGFGLAENFTGETITTAGSVFTTVDTSHFPAVPNVDVCATTAGGSCSTGAGGGLTNGNSDTFVLDLTGGSFGSPNALKVTLDALATKWQGERPLSFELPGRPRKIPEPTSLALLGVALAGFTAFRRRRPV
jgi:PEP-CTERM motif